ncbi:RNA-binding protein 48 [Synchiropus picturatus]
MAAPRQNNSSCWKVPEVYKHHEQQKVCISRPKYREGRKDRAVKVYTINLESCYVMIQGVPAIGVMNELVQLCALYGVVQEYRPLDEYPAEEFTEVYLVKFQRLTSARTAKRRMDETSFYGGVLHVCYVPEYETVEDTRLKLQDRRRYIMQASHNRVSEKDREQIKTKGLQPAESHPERTHSRHQSTSVTQHKGDSREGATGESSEVNQYMLPLLPPPPQENPYYLAPNKQTEDKMGTLHNAVTENSPMQGPGFMGASSHGDSQAERTSSQSNSVRFLPRKAHMESRKRNMHEEAEPLHNSPLIGPQLPEPPKLDMEDDSLNRTVTQIRSTMKQVESLSVVQPPPKKIKPRRRI